MTKAKLSPTVSVTVMDSRSSTPSPAQMVVSVAPPTKAITPPSASQTTLPSQSSPTLRTTVRGLDRSKQPVRLPAVSPTIGTTKSSSKASDQIRQVPAPASSRLKGWAAGRPRITPSASVMTKAKLSPTVSVTVMDSRSSTPSPAQMVVSVAPPTKAITPPSASQTTLPSQSSPTLRTTVRGLDRSKQPVRLPAVSPTIGTTKSSSKASDQIRQVPAPASSRLKGWAAGRPRMMPLASVITKAKLSPTVSVTVMDSRSSTPSPAQMVVSVAPPTKVILPPSASQSTLPLQLAPALRTTVSGLERS